MTKLKRDIARIKIVDLTAKYLADGGKIYKAAHGESGVNGDRTLAQISENIRTATTKKQKKQRTSLLFNLKETS